MEFPTYNDTMMKGVDWFLSLAYEDTNGSPIPLTGFTADCEIREKESGLLLETPTIGALGSSGIVALSLTAAKTAAISAVMAKYDVLITSPGGVVTCLCRGDIEILERVTQ